MHGDHSKQLESLYAQAVDLGDQARGWFDGPGLAWRAGLVVDDQAAVAAESLATTARLLGVMAWLLDPAQTAGDVRPRLPIEDDGPDLPPRSPLAGTVGGAIAVAARRLVGTAAGLAALAPSGAGSASVGQHGFSAEG